MICACGGECMDYKIVRDYEVVMKGLRCHECGRIEWENYYCAVCLEKVFHAHFGLDEVTPIGDR